MVKFKVNSDARAFDGDPSMPLLWYLRDELGLTGTKFGCGAAPAAPAPSMSTASRPVLLGRRCRATASVVTIEGLDPAGQPSGPAGMARRQRAAMRLLPGRPDHAGGGFAGTPTATPTDEEILDAMSGNICRCGCYQRIHAAVRAASEGSLT